MKHVKIRRIAAVLAFFLLWAGVEACVRYFSEPVEQAWPTIREDRKAVEGSIDTVFVGASLFRNGIIPSVFDETLGGRSFNYATSSQTMELSYYALGDLSQTNPLKLALIDISVNRLLADTDDAVHIAKYVVLSHMVNPKAQLELVRDCFTLDELPFILLHSARDQLHFFWGTLPERLKPEFFRTFLKYGYMPDATYPVGSMGYTPSDCKNPAGGVTITDIMANASSQREVCEFEQLPRVIRQCREKGITPVLISMPTTDAYLLAYDWYEALEAPVKALAEQEGALYLDFNLSKFRVEALNDPNFTDARHLNSSGAELFTPLLSEVVKKALAGEDVSGYFYNSYDEMIHDVDRVAAVKCEVRASESGLSLHAVSLHGPDVAPTYRYYIRAKGTSEADYQMLEFTGDWCDLNAREPGVYKVRIEAYSQTGSPCDAYAETMITVK